MAAATLSVEDQLKQLDTARKLVLGDATFYEQVVKGILPLIGAGALVEFRRWGADFLAETFASPILPAEQKEIMSLEVLELLKSMIENPVEDAAVVKSVVQTAASIYPFVFRWIIANPYDSLTWERMTAIKTRIFRIWDSVSPGIRICCVKFAQRVVYVQTNGIQERQRTPNSGLEISAAMVQPQHPLLQPRNLEAEASGLLDRMLGVFHENTDDAILIDATLNSMSILIRTRPPIAPKILNAILNFNPLKLANSPMTSRLRVVVKSMEKTTRMLLIHVIKRDPHNPLATRIHQHIERLIRSRTEIFEEATRKRGPPESTDGFDLAKRQRLNAVVESPSSRAQVAPLPPGQHTIADLFTITTDEGLKAFDVAQLGPELVTKIGITILSRLDGDAFNHAINGIRSRYLALENQLPDLAQLDPNTAPLGVDDDDDDYEPDFHMAEDTEQILNKLDNAPPKDAPPQAKEIVLSTFTMPAPEPMTAREAAELGRSTVTRVFGMMQTLEEPALKKAKAGINRLAASTNDRDAWITVLTRLATRSVAGLEDEGHDEGPKLENGGVQNPSLSNTIREALYMYVLEDFRKRIDVAVSWLSEEWYSDRIQIKIGNESSLHYDKWVLRVLDGFIPYLDARDKVLTRFLSEVPAVNIQLLDRVKGLCRDPAMVNLALTSLLYLVMMKPPARDIALDAVQEIWSTYDDAKPMASKYLSKWRPGFVERNSQAADEESKNGTTTSKSNGVAVV